MIKSVLFICLLLAVGGFNLPCQAQDKTAHKKWLQERLVEAKSITKGMTRDKLLETFTNEGIMQGMLPERYVLKSCSLISVDVEFEMPEGVDESRVVADELYFLINSDTFPDGNDFLVVPDKELKIKSISKPYLQLFGQ